MSLDKVKEYLLNNGFSKSDLQNNVIILSSSTATVELAAKAINVEEGQIAKTIALLVNEKCVLVCTAGDVLIDNAKFKNYFKVKPKMVKHEDVFKYTNHEVGGVCPFSLGEDTLLYLDESLRRYEYVYPACGSTNSTVKISIQKLFKISKAVDWINVCKEKQYEQRKI